MVDTHCHLDDFDDPNEVVTRAKAGGVGTIITSGAGEDSSRKAVQIARQNPGVWATVGLGYDLLTGNATESFLRLAEMTGEKKVVAVGECGLDKSNLQPDLFEKHIRLAIKAGLPIVVHNRGADPEIAEMLENSGKGLVGVMLHCFTGTKGFMTRMADRGYYFGIGGIATFKSSGDLRQTIKEIPESQLLLETDAPYLAPEPVRGSRNEPKNVKITAATVAGVRNASINQIEEITTANARRFFTRMAESII